MTGRVRLARPVFDWPAREFRGQPAGWRDSHAHITSLASRLHTCGRRRGVWSRAAYNIYIYEIAIIVHSYIYKLYCIYARRRGRARNTRRSESDICARIISPSPPLKSTIIPHMPNWSYIPIYLCEYNNVLRDTITIVSI